MYVLEELSERGEAFTQHNQLKAEMTAPVTRFEWKGGLITHVRNFARYIFNSCIAAPRRMANNREYFKPIWRSTNMMRPK